MKIRTIIFVLLCAVLASCGEDRRTEYVAKTALDHWIYEMMEQNYYWNDDMPSGKNLNYFTKAPTFFKSLLSSKDASRSYVEDKNDTESLKSYGISFASTRYNDTAYAVKVLYVDSDSPAKEAGLKRGDWIIRRNERYLLKSRVDSLYKGNAISLTLGEYVIDEDGNPTADFKEKDNGRITLGAARKTSDNPVHYSGTYTASGKKIGYLAYNRFTAGTDDGDESYNNQLRAISNVLQSENLSDFILDLRYNTGGDLKSAQLLGSILAPASALGKAMCHLKYNEKMAIEKNETMLFSTDVLGSGSNLNVTKLYIITGSTTGGTSDVLINSLKAYTDVTIIGQTTKGNFAGTHAYSHEMYPQYVFYPVDCLIYNANTTLPESGFTPTYAVNELDYEIYPIGDVNEVLLYLTTYIIVNGALPATGE